MNGRTSNTEGRAESAGWWKLLALLVLAGCQQDAAKPQSAAATKRELKPFAVKSNDRIERVFYRDVELETLLKQLPSGSIDAIELNLDGGSKVFAIVKIADRPGQNLAEVRFETTFHTQDGQVIDKHWKAAEGRTAGDATALFCLPASVISGETRIVSVE